jgi:hypothetical protein
LYPQADSLSAELERNFNQKSFWSSPRQCRSHDLCVVFIMDYMTNSQQRQHVVRTLENAVDSIVEECGAAAVEAAKVDAANARNGKAVPSLLAFRDGSVPLWRALVEAIEELFKHKLLRRPRQRDSMVVSRRGSSGGGGFGSGSFGGGDPGEVFAAGVDDQGFPPERSDMFFRYLDVLVASAVAAAKARAAEEEDKDEEDDEDDDIQGAAGQQKHQQSPDGKGQGGSSSTGGGGASWWVAAERCLEVARAASLPMGTLELGWGRGRLLVMELLVEGVLGKVAQAVSE